MIPSETGTKNVIRTLQTKVKFNSVAFYMIMQKVRGKKF